MTRFIPNPQKKIDESWKERIATEKTAPEPEAPSRRPVAKTAPAGETVANETPKTEQSRSAPSGKKSEGDFLQFLSTLAMQAYVALGDMEDPATGTIRSHLPQAKYMIDLIGLLEEKTTGNLTNEEQHYLSGLLYELRMRYVEKTQPPMPQMPPNPRGR